MGKGGGWQHDRHCSLKMQGFHTPTNSAHGLVNCAIGVLPPPLTPYPTHMRLLVCAYPLQVPLVLPMA
jgi:hypothetical protein